jgi:hypothetical protein
MTQLMTSTSSLLQTYFFKLIDLSFLSLKPEIAEGRSKYHKSLREKIYKQNVFFNDYSIDDLGYSGENKIGESHHKRSEQQREALMQTSAGKQDDLPLENITLITPSPSMPVVFIEQYALTGKEDKLSWKTESMSDTKASSVKIVQRASRASDLPSQDDMAKEVTILKTRPKTIITKSPSREISDEECIPAISNPLEQPVSKPSNPESENVASPLLFPDRVPELEAPVNIAAAPGQSGESVEHGIQPEIPSKVDDVESLHLVVFVHGYEGCSFDMKLLKNMFCFIAKSHLVFHSATANESDSTSDIEIQGAHLASEVIELIKFNFRPNELKK